MDVVGRRISLTAWGRLDGFDKATTARLHHAGRLPPEPRIEQLPNGRCHVVVPPAQDGRCVVYACVASADQKDDPGRQVGRGVEWATQHGHRRRWRRVADQTVGIIVMAHRARVTRFRFEHVEAALAGGGACLRVMEEGELEDDLVWNATEVLTSLCARLYGRRSAQRRAERTLVSVQAG
ncbi:MAG: IS607 family transposase [Caldilineaceae bacterium SB0665_bin_21]|nr:IS607 family transposase [Caldilineaceae bacterium SB0665_bin_21]MYA05492.1 IS607 family transposase [Caldilineaceae bacterium SB0664_bin_22]MYC63675.1 IS607 family transposase [Caldilineaceae bacterium SB0661_bin_34]